MFYVLHRARWRKVNDSFDPVQKSRIYHARIVCCKYHRDVSVDVEALSELGENLVEHSLNIPSRVRRRLHPSTSNSISLIDEEDSRSCLPPHLEHFFTVLRLLSHPLRHNLAPLPLQQ